MAQPFRTLLPASGSQSSDSTPPASLSLLPTFDVPRRVSVSAACDPCRSRRSKCDGQRPRCAACINRGIECEYETQPTETRTQALKRKVKASEDKLGAHEDLYEFLASRPDDEVAMVLDRIKGGMEISHLRDLIRSGETLLQFAKRPEQPDTTVTNPADTEESIPNRSDSQATTTGKQIDPQDRPPTVQSGGDRLAISALLRRETPPPG